MILFGDKKEQIQKPYEYYVGIHDLRMGEKSVGKKKNSLTKSFIQYGDDESQKHLAIQQQMLKKEEAIKKEALMNYQSFNPYSFSGGYNAVLRDPYNTITINKDNYKFKTRSRERELLEKLFTKLESMENKDEKTSSN